MLHIPLLRGGRPYRSLTTATLTDCRTGEPVARVSQANPGLIARDLAQAAEAAQVLGQRSTSDLLDLCRTAAERLAEAELPLGDQAQGPEDYLRQVSSTTGLPVTLARRNLAKNVYVLREMKRVIAGLTRGLPWRVMDQGWDDTSGRMLSFRREADVLGAVLPSNSPGVHSLWLPSIPLKVPLALKPGRQEPWTPYRVAQAFIAAGAPPEAFHLYPTSHAGASELLLRCDRSLLFGDQATVAPWRGDPRVQLHGPGWSKVLFGPDRAPHWEDHLDLLKHSVTVNGGRSCVNASGIWTPSHGRALAEALAERFAGIEARDLDDPEARLAAAPSREGAERVSAYLDARLAEGDAEDVSAAYRAGGRVAEVDGCAFLLPTVLYTTNPRHALAQTELLFPLVTVVEAPADELFAALQETLALTLISDDPDVHIRMLRDPRVDRLNLGPIPTTELSWDQPHEGNLFEHLYRQRSLQLAPDGDSPRAVTAREPA